MPDKFLDKLLPPLFVTLSGGVIMALITAVVRRFMPGVRVRVWAWRTWILHFRCGFFFRQRRSRRNARIICLEEYVDELKAALDKLAVLALAVGTKKCEILVKVFTMQLPSDWPLWFGGATDRNTLETTPLGRYIVKFRDFVAGTGDYEGIQVNVTRCIVIDNYGSPKKTGEAQLEQLKKDVAEEWYGLYSQFLHGGNEEQAFYLEYDKPWPSWLADSVFFGIRMKDHERGDAIPKWLYGFTTSYNPGEDVLIYRYHYLRHPGHAPEDFPEGVTSIAQMPTNLGLTEQMKPLSSLLIEAEAKGEEN